MKKQKFFPQTPVLSLPNLLEFQIEAYNNFLKKGLKKLFDEFSPIVDDTQENYELYFLDYFLEKPKVSAQEAKQNGLSYVAPLRVKTLLKIKPLNKVKENTVYFCNFPLMTERGTFILNGVERVVVSQLLRSPGVFFTAKRVYGRQLFGAKILPSRGIWLEFETDLKGVIWAKIDRRRKVPATLVLRVFGVESDEEIEKLFEKDLEKSEINYIKETLKADYTKDYQSAVIEFYSCLRGGEKPSFDVADEFVRERVFDPKRYNLTPVGRWKMNQRLNRPLLEDIQEKDLTLQKEDIIETIREIIRLNQDPEAKPDNIDHLSIRRVRTIAELLESKLRNAMIKVERLIKDKMSITSPEEAEPRFLINSTPFANQLEEFFTLSQLSQFMDNVNPLSELEHKRRLTAIGEGGVKRKRAGFEIRDVQPSHYGKICPVQTPEGQNVGLITHLALFAKVNPFGFLQTPYFKVKNGKVTKEVEYLDAHEEEKRNIASFEALLNAKDGVLPSKVEGRKKGEPATLDSKEVEFVEVAPYQILSASVSLIPFLEHDDANRALMGANMQRQAVPLWRPEKPLVATGTEKEIGLQAGYVILAKNKGKVIEVDAEKIKIKTSKGIDTYHLPKFIRSNQYTCITFKPRVNLGDEVKEGDVIADGPAMVDGELALGRNLLCAFIPWRGYNYEDAIIISERVAREDFFTSVHLEDFTCDVRETELGPEVTTNDIPNVSERKLANLDKEGIILEGTEVKSGDILVGKISPKGEEVLSPEEMLLRKIFGEKAKEVKDTSLVLEHGKRGKVVRVTIFDREKGWKGETGVLKRIQVEIGYLRKIKVGDKLAGRHGNKGVIAKILPVEDMPFLEDGTPVDIILNPLSVASRMNLGQIFEMHLGIAAKKLGYQAIVPPFTSPGAEGIKKELKKAGFDEDGKVTLYDGRTGEPFKEKIAVGYIYMLKLIHMVEDKIHMRSIGPYSLITQQPLGGRAHFGGQRFGEMEVWALEGYGAAYTLQEMLTIKSDDVVGRTAAYQAVVKGEKFEAPSIPSSFKVLMSELKSICLNIKLLSQKDLKK